MIVIAIFCQRLWWYVLFLPGFRRSLGILGLAAITRIFRCGPTLHAIFACFGVVLFGLVLLELLGLVVVVGVLWHHSVFRLPVRSCFLS